MSAVRINPKRKPKFKQNYEQPRGLLTAASFNPTIHYPTTERGRPRKGLGRPPKLKALQERIFPGLTKGRPRVQAYWKADLYATDGYLDSIIGQGTKQTAMAEAAGFVGKPFNTPNGKMRIARVELNGPYANLDAMEADITEDEQPQVIRKKKKRGRPKGSKSAIKVAIKSKGKRGRPKGSFSKKHTFTTDELVAVLKASKTPVVSEAPKKRGRPRKVATVIHSEAAEMARFNPKHLIGGIY